MSVASAIVPVRADMDAACVVGTFRRFGSTQWVSVCETHGWSSGPTDEKAEADGLASQHVHEHGQTSSDVYLKLRRAV